MYDLHVRRSLYQHNRFLVVYPFRLLFVHKKILNTSILLSLYKSSLMYCEQHSFVNDLHPSETSVIPYAFLIIKLYLH